MLASVKYLKIEVSNSLVIFFKNLAYFTVKIWSQFEVELYAF